MSNSRQTDAIKAGERAQLLKEALQSQMIPIGISLLVIIPLISGFFWGSDVVIGPITEEEWQKIDPNLFTNTWKYWFIKKFIMMICLLLFGLLLLFIFQEKLLYLPGTPIQQIENNPVNYKSPEDRGMKYEEIWLTSKDNTKL